MEVKKFIDLLGSDFYTGVPDSQLKAISDYLYDYYGVNDKKHIIAANEGNCVGLAAGYHLATGKIPVVYLQNSGEGNIINPVTSLINDEVYGIPVIFIIGWRGEPQISDEPQHVYQGKITLQLLKDIDIDYVVLDKQTTEEYIKNRMKEYKKNIGKGRSIAFVIKKGALTYNKNSEYFNDYLISREEALEEILEVTRMDPVVCTTGKASRELYEIRERKKEEHALDFLTVGSMGHSSSIALGIAMNTSKKIWCIDGDGAALMHMGAMAVIGTKAPTNLVHILINNGVHESVGGMPIGGYKVDFLKLAEACQYSYIASVDSIKRLREELLIIKKMEKLCFLEIKCNTMSRKELGRPKDSPCKSNDLFMKYLDQDIIRKGV